MRPVSVLALMCLPLSVSAADITVKEAVVPLAPPTSMVHAAYMTLSNHGDSVVQIVGVRAEGYAMAHLHQSIETDGVASMQPVHMIELAPGQSIVLQQGGLHVMLMRPESPVDEGAEVQLVLELADGTSLPVTAKVSRLRYGS